MFNTFRNQQSLCFLGKTRFLYFDLSIKIYSWIKMNYNTHHLGNLRNSSEFISQYH